MKKCQIEKTYTSLANAREVFTFLFYRGIIKSSFVKKLKHDI